MFESRRAHLAYLLLQTTPQRRAFKAAVGQGNHFLITVLVGLDAVERRVAVAGPEFSTSWAPRDPEASARRSRAFVQRAALSLIVDCLDAYVSDATAEPAIVQEPVQNGRLAAASSTSDRFDVFADIVSQRDTAAWALLHVSRVWRHRLLHSRSRAKLRSHVITALRTLEVQIHADYQGLELDPLLERCESNDAPRFKEAAAIFRAAQKFVEAADEALLDALDLATFCDAVVDSYVMSAEASERVARVANVWGKDATRRRRTVLNLLQESGVSVTDTQSTRAVPAGVAEQIADRTVREMRQRLGV